MISDPEPRRRPQARSRARHAVAQARSRSAPQPIGNTVLAVIYILVVHFVHENNVLARNFTDTCWQMIILESEAPQPQPLPNNVHLNLNLNLILNLNLNCVLAMNRSASKGMKHMPCTFAGVWHMLLPFEAEVFMDS